MTAPRKKSTDIEAPRRCVKVWDRFVRFFHWSVALAFLVAYFSEDELLSVHVWAGYTIGALVILRILWGMVGPQHARFSDFVVGPWTALRYLLDMFTFRAKRHLGHSPAGGVMVLALLGALLATVWSGMELHAVENDAGPLAGNSARVESAHAWLPTNILLSAARADGDEREEKEHAFRSSDDIWEEIHEVLANLVMALVVLHLLGVILASVIHRENLVMSMFTGSKQVK